MLVEAKRKRGRASMGAFTAADVPRRRHGPDTHTHRTVPSPHASEAVGARNALSSVPSLPRTTRPGPSTSSVALARAVAAASSTADRGVLIARAARMQGLVMDRITCANLRRARRGVLLEEIFRLRKVLKELQDEVDATTRNLAAMDRLVQHLERISFIAAAAGEDVDRMDARMEREERGVADAAHGEHGLALRFEELLEEATGGVGPGRSEMSGHRKDQQQQQQCEHGLSAECKLPSMLHRANEHRGDRSPPATPP